MSTQNPKIPHKLTGWLVFRWRYLKKILSEEYQKSALRTVVIVVTFLWSVLALVVVFPQNPVLAWSWRSRLILILGSVIAGQAIVLEAAFRASRVERRKLFAMKLAVEYHQANAAKENR